jgi:hypothetical protein
MVREWQSFIRDQRSWAWFITITLRELRNRERAERELREYLEDLENAAGIDTAWIVAEDLGEIGGRLHFHALIANVDQLSIEEWTGKAQRRFGSTEIRRYYSSGGAAGYVAKRGLSGSGDLHLGGRLMQSTDASEPSQGGRVVIAKSADVPSSLFRMTLGRRRKR